MEIVLKDIGRRYNQEWIFKKVNFTFLQGQSYAVLGPNGSGKSTLLQVIAASLSPSAGKIHYHHENHSISPDHIFQHIALATPYLELIEEFTLQECLGFHFKFKTLHRELQVRDLIGLLELEKSQNKEIRYFSSGMKQRVKLALALCSATPIVLLDEPTTNLDADGTRWYLNMVERFTQDKVLIICSNQAHEYSFCKQELNILDYK